MDNGFLKLARLLIEDADPSVAAAHSFLNYHAKGVTYLNLLRTPDLTAKLYVFDGSHRPTPEGYVVNPHTHAYGFHSTVVLGTMENVVFEHDDERGTRWAPWTVRSTGQPTFRQAPRPWEYIHETSRQKLHAGETYYLGPEAIHSIAVPTGQRTVLFLCQYSRTSPVSRLFTKGDAPDLTGLYQGMGPADYLAALVEVTQVAGLGVTPRGVGCYARGDR